MPMFVVYEENIPCSGAFAAVIIGSEILLCVGMDEQNQSGIRQYSYRNKSPSTAAVQRREQNVSLKHSNVMSGY